jgi:hypothetical protein
MKIPNKEVNELPKEPRETRTIDSYYVGDSGFEDPLNVDPSYANTPMEKLAIMAARALPFAQRSNTLQRSEAAAAALAATYSYRPGLVAQPPPPNNLQELNIPQNVLQPAVVAQPLPPDNQPGTALQQYVPPPVTGDVQARINAIVDRLELLHTEAELKYRETTLIAYQELANVIEAEFTRIIFLSDLDVKSTQLFSLLQLARQAMDELDKPRRAEIGFSPTNEEAPVPVPPTNEEAPVPPSTPVPAARAPGAPRKKSAIRRQNLEELGVQPLARDLLFEQQGVAPPPQSKIPRRRQPVPRIEAPVAPAPKTEAPIVAPAASMIPRVITERGVRELTPEEMRIHEQMLKGEIEIEIPMSIKSIRNGVERKRVTNRYSMLVKNTEGRFDDNLYVEKALLKYTSRNDIARQFLAENAAMISDILNVVRFIKNKESNTWYVRTFFNVPNRVAEEFIRDSTRFTTRR